MSRAIPQQLPYVSAYYRPAMDRREYNMNAINTSGNYMTFPVYPPATPTTTTTTTVYPSRSRSISSRSVNNHHQTRSSSRSEDGHSYREFFSLRRSRSQDSRRSAKSAKSGISSKSLDVVMGVVQAMNPFGSGRRGRSKSRDRFFNNDDDDGDDSAGKRFNISAPTLVDTTNTKYRPARVPTYESAPAPHMQMHPHQKLYLLQQQQQQQQQQQMMMMQQQQQERGREGRSGSRPRAFTRAELEDQASTRRGLVDWIDGRMQDEAHQRDHRQPAQKIQAFQPAWRASAISTTQPPPSRPHHYRQQSQPIMAASSVSRRQQTNPPPAVPPKGYTSQYTYNGYRVRV